MIAPDVALVFLGVAFALAAVPGPDNIFVLTQSALHGRLAGIMVTLGLASGLLFHTTAVALGAAVIFQTSPYAFAALKFAGAAYLIYLAWKAIGAGQMALKGEVTPVEPLKKLYLRGLVMNLSNPKITVFFLAFLPQFVDAARGGVVMQIYQLGILMMLATLVVFGGVALAAGALGEWLRRSARVQIWINRASAMVFVALAANLALAQR